MKRGEIDYVNLHPIVGREQGGRRPVLVVSADVINAAPLVITVVPGTTGSRVHKDYPNSVRIPASDTGLPDETVFMCFQIRAIDKNRFSSDPVGALSAPWMLRIAAALRYCQSI